MTPSEPMSAPSAGWRCCSSTDSPAVADFTRGLTIAPMLHALRLSRANTARIAGDLHAALEDIDVLAQHVHDYHRVWLLRCITLHDLGHIDDAKQALRTADRVATTPTAQAKVRRMRDGLFPNWPD